MPCSHAHRPHVPHRDGVFWDSRKVCRSCGWGWICPPRKNSLVRSKVYWGNYREYYPNKDVIYFDCGPNDPEVKLSEKVKSRDNIKVEHTVVAAVAQKLDDENRIVNKKYRFSLFGFKVEF